MVDSHTSNEVTRLLSRLIARGATLRVKGDRVAYAGPPGLLTDEDDEFIAEHKADVLKALREWERSLDGPAWPLQREGCYTLDGDDACGGCGCIN